MTASWIRVPRAARPPVSAREGELPVELARFGQGRLRERVGEEFDDVACAATGVVLDLMAATESRDGDDGLGVVANGGKESLFADGAGDFIVFRFVTERAGHPAATAIDFGSSVAKCASKQRDGVGGTDQCLLVAVGVVENSWTIGTADRRLSDLAIG